jgi:hypothetical protein
MYAMALRIPGRRCTVKYRMMPCSKRTYLLSPALASDSHRRTAGSCWRHRRVCLHGLPVGRFGARPAPKSAAVPPETPVADGREAREPTVLMATSTSQSIRSVPSIERKRTRVG